MSVLLKSLPALERVSPSLATEFVWRAWGTPRKPRSVPAVAAPVMELARRSRETLGGHTIALYRWGYGPRTILLVHGWEGRASDFAPIVRELRSRERTIIALDAPGHGNSSGRRTNVIQYGAVLAELAARYGRFEAVVSHSLGTPSVAAAAVHGLAADRFVSISGVADLANLVPKYCEILGLGASTMARARTRIEDRYFDGDRGVWHEYSAANHPLPAPSPLLIIHDRSDRMVGFADAAELADAHGPDTRTLATDGLGHYKILSADVVLDEILEFLDTRVQQVRSREPLLV